MSSLNKKISEKRYAEDRRQFKRDEPKKNIRANAEQSSDNTLMNKNSQMKT